jgi:hypothetical protein
MFKKLLLMLGKRVSLQGWRAFSTVRQFSLLPWVLPLILMPLSNAAWAADLPEVFHLDMTASTQTAAGAGKRLDRGRYPVRFNRDLLGLAAGQSAWFTIPNGYGYEVVHDDRQVHPNGDVTWVGFLQGYDKDYRVLITVGKDAVFGTILTPEGPFLIESHGTGQQLIDVKAAGLSPHPFGDDAIPAPVESDDASLLDLPLDPDSDSVPSAEYQALGSAAATNTTVDLIILYTPGMASRYGSGLTTRLNNLVALGNQAYADSDVAINLRLVHTQQVNYSDDTSNNIALCALTFSSDPAKLQNVNTGCSASNLDQHNLSTVAGLRDTYGADLVALIRPYRRTTSGSCGVAWLNGAGSTSFSPDFGFSVNSDGSDGNYYCDDITLTHELGHNMGSAHDRANASGPGAYPYSYGYGSDGVFGTVMSYLPPTVYKFSNPNIICVNNNYCGTVDDDNARSLNNTRTVVSSFKPAKVALVGPTAPTSIRLDQASTNTAKMMVLDGARCSEKIYYTVNLSNWINIPGHLSQFEVGDLNGDGQGDIAGVSCNGNIYYTTNLSGWTRIPGSLSHVITGDWNNDGRDDIAGITGNGYIYYTTNLSRWTNIPGRLSQIIRGDWNGDGRDDLAGIIGNGYVYYTTNLSRWTQFPGSLSQIIAGDWNNDGRDDIAGITGNGYIYYTTNLSRWTNIPGRLSQVTTGDVNGDGRDDIAGISSNGNIYYTTNLSRWTNIPGRLSQVTTGDVNGDGRDDIAGISGNRIYYTTNLSRWTTIPATTGQ